MEPKKPKICKTRIAYDGKKLQLIEEDLLFADGLRETWEHVRLKNVGAKVLAVTTENKLVMVREYRGAAKSYVLRIPTGAIEHGEKPEDAAKRELQEEVGLFPKTLELIEKQAPKSTFFKAEAFLFYATDLEKRHLERDAGEKDMEVLHIALDQVYKMVETLEISDPQTIYAILLLRKYLKTRNN